MKERYILGQLSATSLKQSQRFELCKELEDLYTRRSLLSTQLDKASENITLEAGKVVGNLQTGYDEDMEATKRIEKRS